MGHLIGPLCDTMKSMKHRTFRIYCEGKEFGTDYRTRERALEVKAKYQADFPLCKYYVRAHVEWDRVIFRLEKDCADIDPNVVAVFPASQDEYGNFSSYAHFGQSGMCNQAWYRSTRPATPAEYADLKKELESAPYHYNLKVGKRLPSWRARRNA